VATSVANILPARGEIVAKTTLGIELDAQARWG
jgi:hypothetical protein